MSLGKKGIMNYTLLKTYPHEFFEEQNQPCISLYMPADPKGFDHKKDQLVFKNLVKKIADSLETDEDYKDMKSILKDLESIEDDKLFWDQVTSGLALFANQKEIVIYLLEQEVNPLAIVSNTYHLKPLHGYFQSLETYHILALDQDRFEVHQGDYITIKKIDLPSKIKTTSKEVLGKEHTESYQTHGTYGGAEDGSTFHGHGGKSDEIDIDRLNFFRYVDKTVLEEISKHHQYPLILLSHKEHHHVFKDLSKNPYLIEESIDGSIKDVSDKALKQKIYEINQKRFKTVLDKLIEQYHTLKQSHLSSDQLNTIIKALIEKKVETLFIEDQKIIPGKIDYKQGKIIKGSLSDPNTDDILDDMIELAIKTGSKVYVLDKKQMPTDTSVAAIFRY
jgi:hypothetical protein